GDLMIVKAVGRALATASACMLAWTCDAAAQDQRGVDPNDGLSLVEVDLPDKGAAMRLQLEADRYGVEFNDHYLRRNRNGTVTVTVFGDARGLDRLDAAGYEITRTIEGPRTWERRADHRAVARRRGRRPPRRLLRELRRPLPVGRGEGPAGRLDADGRRVPGSAAV